MTIEFACPTCRATLRLKDEFAGKRGKCPHCATLISVPTVAGEDAAPTVSVASSPTHRKPPAYSSAAAKPAQPPASKPVAAQPAPTDSFTFRCTQCATSIRAPRRAEGRELACPTCGTKQVIRDPGALLTTQPPKTPPATKPLPATPAPGDPTEGDPISDNMLAGGALAEMLASEAIESNPLAVKKSPPQRTAKSDKRRLLIWTGSAVAGVLLLAALGFVALRMFGFGSGTPQKNIGAVAALPPGSPAPLSTPTAAVPMPTASTAEGPAPVNTPTPAAVAADPQPPADGGSDEIALYLEFVGRAADKQGEFLAASRQIVDAATAQQFAAQWADRMGEFATAVMQPRPRPAQFSEEAARRDEELRNRLKEQLQAQTAEATRLKSLPGVLAILRAAAAARVAREADPGVAAKLKVLSDFLQELDAATVLAKLNHASDVIEQLVACAAKITDEPSANRFANDLTALMDEYARATVSGLEIEVEATPAEWQKLEEATARHRGQTLLLNAELKRARQIPGVKAIVSAAIEQQAQRDPTGLFADQIRQVEAATKKP